MICKKIPGLCFSLLCFFLLYGKLLGCAQIGEPRPPLGFIAAKTDIIFFGEIIERKVFERQIDGKKSIVFQLKLKLEKIFKGEKVESFVFSFAEKKNRSSCDEPAPKTKVGEKWVVFLGYGGDDFYTYVRDVQRLSFRYDSQEHGKLLDDLERLTVNPPTAIYGEVSEYGLLSYAPFLEDVKVTLTGKSIEKETRTDEYGRYAFEQIPAGKYRVRIYLPYKTTDLFAFPNQTFVFDSLTQSYFFEYETEVKYRDADYKYFVFDNKIKNK